MRKVLSADNLSWWKKRHIFTESGNCVDSELSGKVQYKAHALSELNALT